MLGSSTLTFACVPDGTDERTRAHVDGICAAIADAVGLPVQAHIASSPASMAWALAEGTIDIAWVSPTLLLSGLEDVTPLVHSVREGVAFYHGVLFVEEGSTIRSPMQLSGTRVAWVAPTSAGGYIFPRLALASHGLDPRTLFAEERFHDSHGNAARAVFAGQADVGASYAVFEKGDATSPLVRAGFTELEAPRPARILFATPPIPSDLVVVSRRVPATVRELLTASLEQMHRRPEVEHVKAVMGADGFAPFDPGALGPLRAQIADGRMLGLIE